jgi:adenine-specific DNA-methyltransferase
VWAAATAQRDDGPRDGVDAYCGSFADPGNLVAAMRYIGNKTRLLDFIRRVLRARGVTAGHAVDPFTGTASVARALKRWRFGVTAADIMQYGYVFARAYVEVKARPRFDGVAAEARGVDTAAVLRHLNRLPAQAGFIHEHYSPAGSAGAQHGRMYFTPENAGRIDAIRCRIEAWHHDGRIDRDAYHTLLASLIEAADRVANTTGVYAAFVKSWQPNALRPLQLRVERHVAGNGCAALHGDAIETVATAGDFELLYLDPPYNARQYAGYYHIPELIARGWFDGPVATRGKTGLIDDTSQRSAWSSSRRCEAAFEQLVATARCRHIVMSYNAEGIIPERTIQRVLTAHGRRSTYRRYERRYRRYRADADSRRQYRDSVVSEYLYCVSR